MTDGEPRPVHDVSWEGPDVRREDGRTVHAFRTRIPDDYAFFEGHFPGDPVLAGAVQLHELVLPCVRRAMPGLGALVGLGGVKFPARIRPGDAVQVRVYETPAAPRVPFEVARDETCCTRGTLAFAAPDPEAHDAVRVCAVIPTFDNPRTLRGVVEGVRAHVDEIVLVDDGSGPEGRAACDALAADGLVRLERRARNGGKGAAVKRGLARARALGFTHALQVDADGQHDLRRIPAFLAAARAHPGALVLGYPEYDASVPRGRLAARRITAFWVALELGDARRVRDAMIGFRVYPVAAALAVGARGERMDFDIEIVVRMARDGVSVVNLPVGVRYPSPDEGGVSHFRPVGDNARFFALHARMCTSGLMAWVLRRGRETMRRARPAPRARTPGEERTVASADDAPEWLSTGERGTLLGIRLVCRLATWVGRRPMAPVVSALALWYRLFDRRAVRASRAWLRRVRGREPGFADVYRHFRAFAQVTLDRIFFLTGRVESLVVAHSGREHVERQVATGRGAVLLGAHLGSFEALRYGGVSEGRSIRILGHFGNARMINGLLASLNPDLAARVIHLGDDPVGTMVTVRARLEAGDLIAMLGDRVGLSERVVRARFFDEEAPFASGPFLLASVMRCPVYLVFGFYDAPNRYTLHCEPFAERVDLPRAGREAALAAWVQRYADRLEAHARREPENWFNFFDFWSRP